MFNKDTAFKININVTITVTPVTPAPQPPTARRIVRTSVDSAAIASVGYDDVALVLEVEFHSGHVYQYASVPSWRYEELMDAPSVGRYFQQKIRDRYTSTKIADAS